MTKIKLHMADKNRKDVFSVFWQHMPALSLRLEQLKRVQVDGKKYLYEYWKDSTTRSPVEDVRDASSQEIFLVVNGASQEYSRAVGFGKLKEAEGKVVICVFKVDDGVLTLFAKRARGLFARHVVVSRAKSAADSKTFSAGLVE